MPSPLDAETVLQSLASYMPLTHGTAELYSGRVGVVIIDPVVGFTRSGSLSDAVSMAPMVEAIDRLCRDLLAELGERVSLFVFCDHHLPDQIEPPYPPHCQEGTGEELLDPQLRWLEEEPRATLFGKDCINGVVGATLAVGTMAIDSAAEQTPVYRNVFVEWVVQHQLDRLLVVGDCTDICVLDFVVAALSVRNHGMFAPLRPSMPIEVFTPACATYHLPDPVALGLPESGRHHGALSAHAAFYFMQARGAVLVDRYVTATST